MPVDRDRDPSGRARNARPRDEFGRPLPRGARGVAGIPEGLTLPPDESLAEAQRLLDAGRAFHAHEVLEGTWKASPAAERELWRGLAQLAVGMTHIQRGNATGAMRLLDRGAERVAGYIDNPPHGIDAAALVDWARSLSARIAAEGLDIDTAPPRLRPAGQQAG